MSEITTSTGLDPRLDQGTVIFNLPIKPCISSSGSLNYLNISDLNLTF